MSRDKEREETLRNGFKPSRARKPRSSQAEGGLCWLTEAKAILGPRTMWPEREDPGQTVWTQLQGLGGL